MMYVSLCQSILYYCVTSWGSACCSHLIKVERAQRAVLKVAYNKPYRYPTDLLYNDTKHLRVRQIFVTASALRYHRSALNNMCNLANSRPRRHHTWMGPTIKTPKGKKSYSFLGCFIYKNLHKTLNIVNDPKLICKRKIVAYLLTLDYKTTENLIRVPK